MTPRPNVTAEMLNVFLRCCGHIMQQVYGRQFEKLVELCGNEFFNMIRLIPTEKQSDASVGRLKTVLDEYKNLKRFPVWKKQ